ARPARARVRLLPSGDAVTDGMGEHLSFCSKKLRMIELDAATNNAVGKCGKPPRECRVRRAMWTFIAKRNHAGPEHADAILANNHFLGFELVRGERRHNKE